MTRRIYIDIRLLLKGAGANVLPNYEDLDKFRKDHHPPIKELHNPYQGIKDGNVIWENSLHGSSSSCRTLMLLLGKETRENCEIVSHIQEERKDCQLIESILKK